MADAPQLLDTLGRPLSFHQQHPSNRNSWVQRAYQGEQSESSQSTQNPAHRAGTVPIDSSDPPNTAQPLTERTTASKYQALGGPWSHSARNSYNSPYASGALVGGEAGLSPSNPLRNSAYSDTPSSLRITNTLPVTAPDTAEEAGAASIDPLDQGHPMSRSAAMGATALERKGKRRSSSTIRHSDSNNTVTVTGAPAAHDEKQELLDPSEKDFARAGMANSIAPQEHRAAQYRLATSGNREPDGWTTVPLVAGKHHIHHKALSKERKQAIKKAFLIYGFITIWLWGCLSFFWGSTYTLESHLPNLSAWYIDLDEDSASFLGPAIANEVSTQRALPSSMTHLGWETRSASEFPGGLADIRNAVVGQKCWVAVVVNANATSAWRNAITNGNASYDPNGAIGVYYQSARFYQVILLYFPALISMFLQTPLTTARAKALQTFVQSYQANSGAITIAQQVPQAVGNPFGYTTLDLRFIPNGAWSAAAPMEASLIYFLIFTFIFAMFQAMARMKTGLEKKLQFHSLLGLRFVATTVVYVFLALWETLIIRAFQVPLRTTFGSGGFPILWALNFVTITACGWALETVVSIIGPAWLPFFLTLWIIMNITSSFYPLELMPRFYRFLRWGIFLNNVEGFKIIAFGTNYSHVLAKHFGILFGIVGVCVIGLTLAIFFQRWKQDRDVRRQQWAKEQNEEKKRSSESQQDEEA